MVDLVAGPLGDNAQWHAQLERRQGPEHVPTQQPSITVWLAVVHIPIQKRVHLVLVQVSFVKFQIYNIHVLHAFCLNKMCVL